MPNLRTSISLGPESTDVALEIKEIMKLGAIADVIRLGITVLRALLTAQKLGCDFIMRRPNGQQFSYSLSNPTEMIPIKRAPQVVADNIQLTEFEAARAAVGGGIPHIAVVTPPGRAAAGAGNATAGHRSTVSGGPSGRRTGNKSKGP